MSWLQCLLRNRDHLLQLRENLEVLVVVGKASAAPVIVVRRGLDKLRHLDFNYLWIEEKAVKGYQTESIFLEY